MMKKYLWPGLFIMAMATMTWAAGTDRRSMLWTRGYEPERTLANVNSIHLDRDTSDNATFYIISKTGDVLATFTDGQVDFGVGVRDRDDWAVQSWKTQTLTPSTDFTITTASGNHVRVQYSGTGHDCTNITDGLFDGQLMTIAGASGTDDFDMINVAGQVILKTSPTTIISNGTMMIQWDATDSIWREI